jgi:hypothetical protein
VLNIKFQLRVSRTVSIQDNTESVSMRQYIIRTDALTDEEVLCPLVASATPCSRKNDPVGWIGAGWGGGGGGARALPSFLVVEDEK